MVKKGMTLIELIVAMTIFIIVMTLAIGGFVAVSRSRILIGNMKDSQQKIRIANEMIIRYAKQAQYVRLDQDGSSVEFFFDIGPVETHSAKKFEVVENDLLYSECVDNPMNPTQCVDWSTPATLFGGTSGITLTNTDVFMLHGFLPAVLEINLNIQNTVLGNTSLSDEMNLQNAIILENLK